MEDHTGKEKYECMDSGCYFWVENRNKFTCPNCNEHRKEEERKDND